MRIRTSRSSRSTLPSSICGWTLAGARAPRRPRWPGDAMRATAMAHHPLRRCSAPLPFPSSLCSSRVVLGAHARAKRADEDAKIGGQSRTPREVADHVEDDGGRLPHTRKVCVGRFQGAARARCPPASRWAWRRRMRPNAREKMLEVKLL